MAGAARTVVLTSLALAAFAANSLLARLALGARAIDAGTFTAIRIVAGAAVLSLVVRVSRGSFTPLRGGGVTGPLSLFAYAMPFSFAYVRIGAAAGALILFGVVQLTMIGYGLARGERPGALSWLGLSLALGGLAALTLPAATRPDPWGAALMAIAGIAWGVYSIAGRTAPDALAANARSFLWGSPLAVVTAVALGGHFRARGEGVVLASLSGAVTSGVGYAIWYRALPRLAVTQAAVAQLSVPVLAALGAVIWLGEPLSIRLALAGLAILSGVALVLSERKRKST